MRLRAASRRRLAREAAILTLLPSYFVYCVFDGDALLRTSGLPAAEWLPLIPAATAFSCAVLMSTTRRPFPRLDIFLRRHPGHRVIGRLRTTDFVVILVGVSPIILWLGRPLLLSLLGLR